MVGNTGIFGVPLNAGIESLSHYSKQYDLGQSGRVTEIRTRFRACPFNRTKPLAERSAINALYCLLWQVGLVFLSQRIRNNRRTSGVRPTADHALGSNHPARPAKISSVLSPKLVNPSDLAPVLRAVKPTEFHRTAFIIRREVIFYVAAGRNYTLKRFLTLHAFDSSRPIKIKCPYRRIKRVSAPVS